MSETEGCPYRTTTFAAAADTDPYPAYAEAAASAPLVWDESFQGWVLLRHADCSRALREVDTFVMPWAVIDGGQRALGRYGIFNLTGEFHERVHKRLLDYFNPRRNPDLVQLVRSCVNGALDSVADRGSFDFHAEVAERIPGMMAFGFMGVPGSMELLHLVHEANGALQRFMQAYSGGQEQIDGLDAAHATLEPHFGPVIRARRHERANDLISHLWDFADTVDDWDEDEMIRQCLFYFGASFGNTANALSNAAWAMLSDPTYARLTDDPAQLDVFVDEVIRTWSAVQFRIRTTTRDVEIAGRHFAAGEKVIMAVGAANRDGEVFDDPAHIHPDRTSARRHLTFGAGPRYCVGATLARLEIRETLHALTQRYDDLRVDPAVTPEFTGANYRHFAPLTLLGRQHAAASV